MGGTATVANRVEPFLRRAMDDDDVREALRRASVEGRKLKSSLSGEGARGGAVRLAADRRLQERLGAAAAALGDATARIADASPRRRRKRRLTTLLGLSALGGLAAVALQKKRAAGSEPEPYTPGPTDGPRPDAVRPAGSPSPLQ
jgi:hypothetical protein